MTKKWKYPTRQFKVGFAMRKRTSAGCSVSAISGGRSNPRSRRWTSTSTVRSEIFATYHWTMGRERMHSRDGSLKNPHGCGLFRCDAIKALSPG